MTAPHGMRRYRGKIFLGGLLTGVVLFAILSFFAWQNPYFPLDLRITLAVQRLDSPFFGGFMSLVSWFGYAPQSYYLTAVIVGILYAAGLRWEGTIAAVAAFGAGILNTAVKILIHRPRPSSDLIDVVRAMDSYSFPSGHVMFYTAFFGFVVFTAYTTLRRSWLRTIIITISGALILFVGLSRIYRGEHWSSDVLGAYLLGGLVLSAAISIYLRRTAQVEEVHRAQTR